MLLKGWQGGWNPKKKSVFSSPSERVISHNVSYSLLMIMWSWSHDYRGWTSFSVSTILLVQWSPVSLIDGENILIACISPAPFQRLSNNVVSWGLETWYVCVCACVYVYVLEEQGGGKEKAKPPPEAPQSSLTATNSRSNEWLLFTKHVKACPLLTWRRSYGFWRVKFPFWFVLHCM